jgi:hypothetical protein
VDQRLVRDRYIESITHPAAALYLFLVTVADSQGLSYYSDASIMTRLSMDASTIEQARCNLVTAGLIAFNAPIYQVLSLEPQAPISSPRVPLDGPVSLGQIFKQMMGDDS